MGLFGKLFEKKEESVEKIEYLEDKLNWYLSSEAENVYNSVSYSQRKDFICEYLLMFCYLIGQNKDIRHRMDWYNEWKAKLDERINSFCVKLSYIFVLFIIDSESLNFSGYKNALSVSSNPILHFLHDPNSFRVHTFIEGDKTAKTLIELIHERKYNEFKTYKHFIESLSKYDNKELYLIERAIISLFSNNKIIQEYGINDLI